MYRIADEVLLTHLEVALAVAPEPTLAGLNADDPRAERRARVDLARHLVERMRGLVIEGEGYASDGIEPCLFPGNLAPIG